MTSVEELTARIVAIARYGISHELTAKERAQLVNEVETLAGDLYELNEGRRLDPDASRAWVPWGRLGEKLTGLCSFTRMALGEEVRGGYTSETIIEKVERYQYAVERLMG